MKQCVKDIPELTWLPQTTAHSVVATMMNNEDPRRSALPPGMARVLPDEEDDPPRIDPSDDKPDPEELRYVPEKLHHKWISFSKH
jgi:hypothetical protein